jgi:hypothetical protein
MPYIPLSDDELRAMHMDLRKEFDYAKRQWSELHPSMGSRKANIILAMLALEEEICRRQPPPDVAAVPGQAKGLKL